MLQSVRARLIGITVIVNLLSNLVIFELLGGDDYLLLTLVSIFTAAFCLAITWFGYAYLSERFQALEIGLLNFKDNEFSSVINEEGNDEFSKLCALFNSVSASLRAEKQSIYQRELLLDKVIESSPIVMFLVDDDGYFVYSNSASRHLLFSGKKLEGHQFSDVVKRWPESLQQAISKQRDSLFSIEKDKDSETWHLSTGRFVLNSRSHTLYLLKQMTKELNRQEVEVWKKVIRVISHELNNSLAPISSVSHSGNMIAEKIGNDKLALIFDTIKERVEHLNTFISGYAKFAKLPIPVIAQASWGDFISKLQQQVQFKILGTLPEKVAYFDLAQLEQVMINLLKNAHESGSSPEEVELQVSENLYGFEIVVLDRGTGMSEQVLKNALVPFYSTKQTGTGLGLALCREIIEAHEGRIAIHNRQSGGLEVTLFLPHIHSDTG
ncbi:sensor histidine kinase [Thalassotalea fusca]